MTEGQLLEAIRDAQTEILKGFFPFQESIAAQFRSEDAALRSYNERIQILERRLLMNPPAAWGLYSAA